MIQTYGVMLIDDDASIREHLKSMIEWERLGLRLCCEAGDSETARELYTLHRPKIIVTDINIPIVSGLELAKELSRLDPEIRFIVITAYSDFDYVRSTVALGAVELLSKPLLPEAVNQSLQKAADYFHQLRREKASARALSQLVEENLPMLQEKYVARLLNHYFSGRAENVKERLRALGLSLNGVHYAVVLIVPSMRQILEQEAEPLLAAAKKISGELLTEAGFSVFSFYDDYYRVNCLVNWSFENGDELLEEAVNKIYEQMMFLFQVPVFAGIGMQVEKPEELSLSAEQALTALNYQGVLGSETVIHFKNVARLDAPERYDKHKLLENIGKLFRMNNYKDIEQSLQEQMGLAMRGRNPLAQGREFAFEYVSAILSECFSLGLNVEAVAGYSDIFTRVFASESLISLRQYLLELTEKLLQVIFRKRSDSKNRLILLAKQYIEENLGNENLNLEAVSSHIGLSGIYFCKLFHKEEGVSFNDYLNNRRIARAKELLTTTSKKVFEISSDVGYNNPKYFSYVFKRIAGVTPMEYKNSQ